MPKNMFVSKEFTFDAAHQIVDYNGKCEKLHGHTYRLRVSLKGERAADGMVLDFAVLKQTVQEKVLSRLDHGFLNDIDAQSTTENIAVWIWEQLEAPLRGEKYRLYEIVLWETATSFVTLREDV